MEYHKNQMKSAMDAFAGALNRCKKIINSLADEPNSQSFLRSHVKNMNQNGKQAWENGDVVGVREAAYTLSNHCGIFAMDRRIDPEFRIESAGSMYRSPKPSTFQKMKEKTLDIASNIHEKATDVVEDLQELPSTTWLWVVIGLMIFILTVFLIWYFAIRSDDEKVILEDESTDSDDEKENFTPDCDPKWIHPYYLNSTY